MIKLKEKKDKIKSQTSLTTSQSETAEQKWAVFVIAADKSLQQIWLQGFVVFIAAALCFGVLPFI